LLRYEKSASGLIVNARSTVTTSILVLILGVALFLLSFPLENYRVESAQPNGLSMITYPLDLIGFILALLGIGMVVFGLVFMSAPVAGAESRRAVLSSALVGAGAPLIFLSIFGALANYTELDVHFCTSLQPEPVCGSIVWIIVDFAVIGVAGTALIVMGAFLRLRRKNPEQPSILGGVG
jgi:hypothetical protein